MITLGIALGVASVVLAIYLVHKATTAINESSEQRYGFKPLNGWTIGAIFITQVLVLIGCFLDQKEYGYQNNLAAALALMAFVTTVIPIIVCMRCSAGLAIASLPLLHMVAIGLVVCCALVILGSGADTGRRRYC